MKNDTTALFASGGEMASRMGLRDWSQTPLGPPRDWPQSLRAVVRVMLTSRYAMWMAWGDELTFFCNDAYLPTLGVKGSWALGSSARQVWQEIWPDIGPRIDHVLRNGEATWDEGLLLFLERSGYPEETYQTFSYSPLADDQGRTAGMLCVVTEETERVIGERRLAALRDLAASLAESTTEARLLSAVQDSIGRARRDFPFALIYLNAPGGAQMQLAARVGLAAGARLAPAELRRGDPAAVWPIERLLGPAADDLVDVPVDGEFELEDNPWPRRPERAALLPLMLAGGSEPAGVLVVGLNPFRPFDEAARAFAQLFAGQLAAGLSNARAYESERRRAEALAEVDRAKTAFFSNVSHEFRTPLTLMLGPLADALAETGHPLPPRAHEDLTIVHRNGLRLLKLVNTLLEFSRLEAGRVEARFVRTNLPDFTAELASVFRSALERAGLTLEIEAPPTQAPAYVDRDMWEKVVFNLLSNAFKFTFHGGIRVRLETLPEFFRLSVQDTGTGIPPAELSRLFERFHRVAGAVGRTHEGTGIGLALVQELARAHGGTVRVESVLGQGSCFIVEIPAGRAHLPPGQVSEAASDAAHPAGVSLHLEEALRWLPEDGETAGLGEATDDLPPAQPTAQVPDGRRRLLVADDNADMRDYLHRLLREHWDVRLARDGAEALEMARRDPPDLVLSDVMMPQLDGFGLLAALRAEPGLATIPIILLSARAGEDATLDGLKAGADDYLIKPFSARELLARVDAQLQRRAFERRLASTEHRLQSALAAVRMVAYEWDLATDRVTLSPNASEVLGLRPGGQIEHGESGFDLLHPEDRQRQREIIEQARRTAEGFEAEFRIVRPRDGRIAWLEQRVEAIRDPETGHVRLVGFVQDITERKHNAAALRESEDQARFVRWLDDGLRELQAPADVSNTAARLLAQHLRCDRAMYCGVEADGDVCQVDGEYSPHQPSLAGKYRISDFGEAYAADMRANRPHVETDTTADSLAPEERARFAALGIGAFITAPLYKDGRLVALFVVHSTSPRAWREREIEAVTLVANRCWESIERARVGRALVVTEARLAFSIEAADLGTFSCPMPLGPIIWNPQGKAHFWLGPDEEFGFDRFYAQLHPDDREATRAAVEATVFHRAPYDVQFRAVAPDGRIRWIRAKGRAEHDVQGQPTRFDGVTLDITELKHSEGKREETLGAERAAREEAERVNRMKDEFLATLSHELRTPLNAILGWAQLLAEDGLSPAEVKEGVVVIQRNARAQTQIIEDLLDMSRIISGNVRLDVQRLILAEVVGQAVQSVRPAAELKGVRLISVLDPYAGSIAGDPGRIQQVVWNLLTNAIKFTPRGGRVQVVLEAVNSQLELSVADSGEGIEAGFLPFIFERFRQADSSSTRRHGGLGLGLSIVRQLVELHGGSVRAASPGKGQGSTFTIQLPLAALAESQGGPTAPTRQHPRRTPAQPQPVPQQSLAGLSILLVDDDADARELLRRILTGRGAKVEVAASAPEARQRLRETVPDLLISDIGMPGEDGYELIRKVRLLSAEEGGRISAVALTAFARTEDRQRALLAGYQMHVAKPVDPSELLAVCASLRERRPRS